MKFLFRFRTINAAALVECSELASPNAVQLADAPADGWYLISPLGSFPAPDFRHTQVFGLDQAQEVVRTFNSLTGRAGLYFKNMWHGLGAKASVPIFEGHADADPKRWKTLNQLGEIGELRADAEGLWGNVTWNADGLARRSQELGPLKPSPIFWHEPKNDKGQVFPELLESVGLVRFPNIKTAPTWTQNAAPTLASDPQAEGSSTHIHQNIMNEQQMKELRKALGLSESADVATILSTATTANAAVTTLTERDSALTTANAARATLETQLSTANGQVTSLTTERDNLRTTNGALTTEVAALRKGLLDFAEGKGAITPAERASFETRIATEATRNAAIEELPKRKAMNTQSVEINGNRVDLTTANARGNALQTEIAKRMKDNNGDYNAAYASVKADPNFAGLFAAMQDPTRKGAA